ncbi:uncharacterized protein LDX57_013034 [Aspergillus melleus]|uniref:uncharacterized protein n=1 Tax=Aspergillus melleus TaxID=138277 RepID=UPI001E8EBBD1|nr:uncharacterized protein LDX57_013034 [Aspergillus melleus]KAH8435404.1 hypothetical protein LDX57_013034 [Aspergillus melleus]
MEAPGIANAVLLTMSKETRPINPTAVNPTLSTLLRGMVCDAPVKLALLEDAYAKTRPRRIYDVAEPKAYCSY